MPDQPVLRSANRLVVQKRVMGNVRQLPTTGLLDRNNLRAFRDSRNPKARESGGAIANRGRLRIGLIDVTVLFRGRSLLCRSIAPLKILESGVRTQGI